MSLYVGNRVKSCVQDIAAGNVLNTCMGLCKQLGLFSSEATLILMH